MNRVQEHNILGGGN